MCGALPVALLATGLQTANTIRQGNIAEKQAKADARAASVRAGEAEADSVKEAALLRVRQSADLARRRAAFARSGVRLTGSPLISLGDVSDDYDSDIETVLEEGRRQARGLRGQASAASARGLSTRLNTGTRVGTSLLTGG